MEEGGSKEGGDNGRGGGPLWSAPPGKEAVGGESVDVEGHLAVRHEAPGPGGCVLIHPKVKENALHQRRVQAVEEA
jgi:hypothetical protein